MLIETRNKIILGSIIGVFILAIIILIASIPSIEI